MCLCSSVPTGQSCSRWGMGGGRQHHGRVLGDGRSQSGHFIHGEAKVQGGPVTYPKAPTCRWPITSLSWLPDQDAGSGAFKGGRRVTTVPWGVAGRKAAEPGSRVSREPRNIRRVGGATVPGISAD